MSKILCNIFLLLSLAAYSQNTLVSGGNIFEGEPYLVINPQNQQHLVAAWMGFQLNQKICIKSAVSMDGGNSWSSPIAQNHEEFFCRRFTCI